MAITTIVGSAKWTSMCKFDLVQIVKVSEGHVSSCSEQTVDLELKSCLDGPLSKSNPF